MPPQSYAPVWAGHIVVLVTFPRFNWPRSAGSQANVIPVACGRKQRPVSLLLCRSSATMTASDSSLRIGDEVTFRGATYRLAGLDRDVALLAVAGESPVVTKGGALFADHSFNVTGSRPERRKIVG